MRSFRMIHMNARAMRGPNFTLHAKGGGQSYFRHRVHALPFTMGKRKWRVIGSKAATAPFSGAMEASSVVPGCHSCRHDAYRSKPPVFVKDTGPYQRQKRTGCKSLDLIFAVLFSKERLLHCEITQKSSQAGNPMSTACVHPHEPYKQLLASSNHGTWRHSTRELFVHSTSHTMVIAPTSPCSRKAGGATLRWHHLARDAASPSRISEVSNNIKHRRANRRVHDFRASVQ